MRAEDGQREELNWMEKEKGYGFDIKPDPSVNGYKMTLMALPQQQITVKKAGTPSVPRWSSAPASRFREGIHQCLRRSDGAQSPLYHAVRKRPEDGGKRSQKIVPK